MTFSRVRQCMTSPVLVAAVCLVVQGVYLVEQRRDPTFDTPIVDAGVYHDAAIRFANGEPLIDDAFWQPPLFPLLLGSLYRLVGPNILVARSVLAGVAVLSCLTLWWIGRRIFSNRVGVVAGLMLAVYGPFVLFSTRLLPTGLAVFLDLLAIALWIRCIESSRWHRWLLLGLTIGAATITVANAAVLIVLVPIGAVITSWRERRRRSALLAGSMCFFGLAAVIAPVSVRNYVASGEWVVLSTNRGINFFIGNNAHRDETLAVRPGAGWRRLARTGFAEGAWTRAQQDTYFFRRGIAYLKEHPLDFLRGLGVKAVRLIHAREIPRNRDPYLYRDYSFLLSTLMWRAGPLAFPFGLLAPLAVLGFIVSTRDDGPLPTQRRGRTALMAFIVAYGLSIVLFFVSSRYRLPMAVAMMPLAASGAMWLFDSVAREHRRPRQWVTAGLVFAAVGVAVHWPIRLPTDRINFRAEQQLCLGSRSDQQGNLDKAEVHLRRALALVPQYVEAGVELARVLTRRGQLAQAEHLLRQARTWDRRSSQADIGLARLLRNQNRLAESLSVWEEAVAIDPTSAEAQHGLATVLAESHRPKEAVEHDRLAIQYTAKNGPILIHLADTLVTLGAYQKAIERYRQALWKFDPDPATLNRIAWLLATCPQPRLRNCRRAIDLAEYVCRITDYHQAAAMGTLAAAYAECGRWTDAVTWARRAVDAARAANDRTTAQAIQSRLRLYEERLAGQAKRRSDSPGEMPPGYP